MGWREKISPKKAWNQALIGSSVFIILLSYIPILAFHHIFFPWDRTDFIQYEATLLITPTFETSRSGPSLKMRFFEAKFEFVIDGDNYSVLQNKDHIKKLKSGDRVSILVDKSQFNAKISRTKSPSFVQRTINWKWIRVYELKFKDQTFLSFDRVIAELKSLAVYYLIFGILGWSAIFFYLRYEFRIYKKSKKNTANSRQAPAQNITSQQH